MEINFFNARPNRFNLNEGYTLILTNVIYNKKFIVNIK